MVKSGEKYLIDANTLITASRLFYAYDLVPAFWRAVGEKVNGNAVLLDMVKAEIDNGHDALKAWVDERRSIFGFCNHVDSEIIPRYADIMKYIQECGYYNDKGLNEWAKNDIADPWLIATAIAKGYIIITFEQSVGTLSVKNKTGKVKIPDVAKHFDVKVRNLFYMMRELKIKI